ncbi:hypothetical protein IE53DRAFT_118695 [Violaceomyces palustris]|uniref:Uncharacterized protein n=1 Tax=Violaceomyces palustris TaxID=1673888 RepID=A0ACD0NVZ1_9BASI|nr:hypothetical protein IE53DRAFT_118695 [Violaceomyces palustris]
MGEKRGEVSQIYGPWRISLISHQPAGRFRRWTTATVTGQDPPPPPPEKEREKKKGKKKKKKKKGEKRTCRWVTQSKGACSHAHKRICVKGERRRLALEPFSEKMVSEKKRKKGRKG